MLMEVWDQDAAAGPVGSHNERARPRKNVESESNPATGQHIFHLDLVLEARTAVYRLMNKAWRMITFFYHKQTSIKFDLVLRRPPNQHGPGAQQHDKWEGLHVSAMAFEMDRLIKHVREETLGMIP